MEIDKSPCDLSYLGNGNQHLVDSSEDLFILQFKILIPYPAPTSVYRLQVFICTLLPQHGLQYCIFSHCGLQLRSHRYTRIEIIAWMHFSRASLFLLKKFHKSSALPSKTLRIPLIRGFSVFIQFHSDLSFERGPANLFKDFLVESDIKDKMIRLSTRPVSGYHFPGRFSS